ncbi:MAG TPA: hypothetical protein ENF48_08745 [Desulfobacteraceae bacterium]|nr:hypothetical protein [Desulfobacteraceae bacterium]
MSPELIFSMSMSSNSSSTASSSSSSMSSASSSASGRNVGSVRWRLRNSASSMTTSIGSSPSWPNRVVMASAIRVANA